MLLFQKTTDLEWSYQLARNHNSLIFSIIQSGKQAIRQFLYHNVCSPNMSLITFFFLYANLHVCISLPPPLPGVAKVALFMNSITTVRWLPALAVALFAVASGGME